MDIQLDTAPCGYMSLSSEGLIRSVNQTLLGMLGYERDALIGKHVESTMSVTNKLFLHTYFYPYIQLYGHVNEMYVSLRTRTGQDVPVLLNGVRQERDGEIVMDCVVVVMRKRIEYEKDVLHTKTKLEKLYQATNEANKKLELLHEEYERKQQELLQVNYQLETMASTDPLTGLKNRRFFQAQLRAHLAAYGETKQPFSLLIFDIDHFKRINDTYGHPVGDLVLSSLGQMLQLMARDNDIVARFGGEEFVVLAPDADEEQAIRIAHTYCSAIAAAPCGGYAITVSIGVATVTPDDTEQTLLHDADTALYASKTNGRNQVTHARRDGGKL